MNGRKGATFYGHGRIPGQCVFTKFALKVIKCNKWDLGGPFAFFRKIVMHWTKWVAKSMIAKSQSDTAAPADAKLIGPLNLEF